MHTLRKILNFEFEFLFRLAIFSALIVVCLRFFYIDEYNEFTFVVYLVEELIDIKLNTIGILVASLFLTIEFAILPIIFFRFIDWVLGGLKK